ncbi:MAG: Fis family transcriptional regulator [Desulfobulbaceae bacterium A2]|nr:MAG: Fis family transcriptional regulator [Desulfobulbaceae bacterium A2]
MPVNSNGLRILVIDDERINLENISHVLRKDGYAVETATCGQQALELMEGGRYDLVITDLKMEGMDGVQVMRHAKELMPESEVIIVTGYATVNSAVEAMALGAFYYLPKPLKLDELRALVAKALEKTVLKNEISRLKQHLQAKKGVTQFVGHNPAILKLKDDIALFAQLDCNVLITGETGTGKELVARTIHELSPRAACRFLPINCAALSEELVLNELFGHEKDAYTGASQVRRGLLEAADGGVVLLDEIGDMPMNMQVKLLRVLQEKKILRVGGTREIPVDIRIVAATNRDLAEEVRRGRFRQDLYYRLNIASLHIGPLRERRDDIPLLVNHFLAKHQAGDSASRNIATAALALLQRYDFPGNVRELENIIERALAVCGGQEIVPRHLPPQLAGMDGAGRVRPVEDAAAAVKSLEDHEREYILAVLASVRGNKSRAARLMGIDRVSLWRKLKKYDEASGADEALFRA